MIRFNTILLGLVALFISNFAWSKDATTPSSYPLPPIPADFLKRPIISEKSTAPISAENQQSQAARWSDIHFKPAIDKASNEQCLACHADVLKDQVLAQSPSGVKATEAVAWYQTLDVYEGAQQTFHQRHLTSKMATELMDLKCSTCHQGHDPSVEISYLVQSAQVKQPINKKVDPKTCLLCHGKFDPKTMPGLAGQWTEVRDQFENDCMICHKIFRTTRHQVNYLKAKAIEAAGATKNDSCYGCHGGRSWYRTAYPYARNAWTGMGLEMPEWAKDRPTQSDPRFLVGVVVKKMKAEKTEAVATKKDKDIEKDIEEDKEVEEALPKELPAELEGGL